MVHEPSLAAGVVLGFVGFPVVVAVVWSFCVMVNRVWDLITGKGTT